MHFRPKLRKTPSLKGMGRLEEPYFWWKIEKYVEVGIYGVFPLGDRSEYLDIRRIKAFEQVKKSTPSSANRSDGRFCFVPTDPIRPDWRG